MELINTDWIPFFLLLVTLLTSFGFLYREMKGIKIQITKDVKIQSQRSDRLYEIFIDLLKSQRTKTEP